MGRLYKGDVGVQLEIDTGIDLAAATVKKLLVKKPGGSLVEWTDTTISGTKIIYVSKAADLNCCGKYLIAAYVEFAGGAKHTGETFSLQVCTPFDE